MSAAPVGGGNAHPATIKRGPFTVDHLDETGCCDCICPRCAPLDQSGGACICPDCDAFICGMHPLDDDEATR